jgi:ABC-type transporter Mla subunit MlaD
VPHLCIPIQIDDCFRAVLSCLDDVGLDGLDDLLRRLLDELLGPIRDLTDIIAGLLQKFAEFIEALNRKLLEILNIEALINKLNACLVDLAVACTPVGDLILMLLARRDEFLRQIAELERWLDPLFGIPAALARYQAIFAEMLCFRTNSLNVRDVIESLRPVPPTPPNCPRPA